MRIISSPPSTVQRPCCECGADFLWDESPDPDRCQHCADLDALVGAAAVQPIPPPGTPAPFLIGADGPGSAVAEGQPGGPRSAVDAGAAVPPPGTDRGAFPHPAAQPSRS